MMQLAFVVGPAHLGFPTPPANGGGGPGPSGSGAEEKDELDFDDLSRRFEQLKKRK